jgi:chromosome segregation ATPase
MKSQPKMKSLLKLACGCVIFFSFALFIKDVHNVTQDRISSLKRDLVLAVEQRDAVRLDVETLKAANSDLLITRKAMQDADVKNKEELSSLIKQRDEHISRIAELERDLKMSSSTQSELVKAREELEVVKSLKAELSKKLESAQESLAQKESISKIAQDREDEIRNLKSLLESRENKLQAAEANVDVLKKNLADLNHDGNRLLVKSVNSSQIQFL